VSLHAVEAGPGDGPPVILLHGFPEFWWGWRRQIDALAAAGYHVIAPDLRGYNMSDKPGGLGAYRIDVLAADVAGLAEAMGLADFSLVALDWGALIAWRVAALYPERLRRVVVMDGPHPDVFGAYAAVHPLQALRSAYVGFFQLPWLPEAYLSAFDHAALKGSLRATAKDGTFPAADLAAYGRAWARPGALSAMINYYRALRLRKPEAPLARVTPPVLILWGQDDAFLDLGLANASLACCADARLQVIEGAGHWLHLEQPQAVNTAILSFLQNAPASLAR
jgi:pimeloyl-ACP methyl ester carboxylesterase